MRHNAGRAGAGAGQAGLAVASIAGAAHAAVSLYWGMGGTWLLPTLGASLAEQTAEHRGLLVLVGCCKLCAVAVPVAMAVTGATGHRACRIPVWIGALALVLWGGLNAAAGNLVLAGVIIPASGFDHSGMVGHAWLWDPLFAVWGAGLVAWLVTRSVTMRRARQPH